MDGREKVGTEGQGRNRRRAQARGHGGGRQSRGAVQSAQDTRGQAEREGDRQEASTSPGEGPSWASRSGPQPSPHPPPVLPATDPHGQRGRTWYLILLPEAPCPPQGLWEASRSPPHCPGPSRRNPGRLEGRVGLRRSRIRSLSFTKSTWPPDKLCDTGPGPSPL